MKKISLILLITSFITGVFYYSFIIAKYDGRTDNLILPIYYRNSNGEITPSNARILPRKVIDKNKENDRPHYLTLFKIRAAFNAKIYQHIADNMAPIYMLEKDSGDQVAVLYLPSEWAFINYPFDRQKINGKERTVLMDREAKNVVSIMPFISHNSMGYILWNNQNSKIKIKLHINDRKQNMFCIVQIFNSKSNVNDDDKNYEYILNLISSWEWL